MTTTEQDVRDWPDRLRELRDRRGLTQEEAADLCRISQCQWSLLESGKRSPTKIQAFVLALLESGAI